MVRFHFHLYVERIMVVFPNGRNGEKLAKRARQSEPHRRRYGDERANSRCSKSFTPDAKMIKGFRRPRTCTFYLHVLYDICGISEKDVTYILRPLASLHFYCSYIYIYTLYTFTNINVAFLLWKKRVSKLKRIEKISCLQYTSCIYTKTIESFILF